MTKQSVEFERDADFKGYWIYQLDNDGKIEQGVLVPDQVILKEFPRMVEYVEGLAQGRQTD